MGQLTGISLHVEPHSVGLYDSRGSSLSYDAHIQRLTSHRIEEVVRSPWFRKTFKEQLFSSGQEVQARVILERGKVIVIPQGEQPLIAEISYGRFYHKADVDTHVTETLDLLSEAYEDYVDSQTPPLQSGYVPSTHFHRSSRHGYSVPANSYRSRGTRADYQELRYQLHEQSARAVDAEDRLAAMQARHSQLSAEHRTQRREFEADYEHLEEENRRHREAALTLQRRLTQSSAHLVSWETQYRALEQDHATTLQSQQHLEEHLRQRDAHIAQLTASIAQLNQDSQRNQASASTQIETLTHERDRLSSERDALVAEIRQTRQENLSLGSELTEARALAAGYQRRIHGLEEQHRDLEAQIGQLRNQCGSNEAERDSLQQRLRELESELEALQVAHRLTTAKMHDLERRHRQTQADSASSQNQHSASVQENQHLRDQLIATETRITQLNARIRVIEQAASRDLRAATEQIATLHQERDQSTLARVDLEQRISDLSEQHQEDRTRIRALTRAQANLKRTTKRAQGQLRSLQASSAADRRVAQETITGLQHELAQSQTALAAVEAQLAEKDQQLRALNRQLTDQMQAGHRNNAEISTLEQTRDQLLLKRDALDAQFKAAKREVSRLNHALRANHARTLQEVGELTTASLRYQRRVHALELEAARNAVEKNLLSARLAELEPIHNAAVREVHELRRGLHTKQRELEEAQDHAHRLGDELRTTYTAEQILPLQEQVQTLERQARESEAITACVTLQREHLLERLDQMSKWQSMTRAQVATLTEQLGQANTTQSSLAAENTALKENLTQRADALDSLITRIHALELALRTHEQTQETLAELTNVHSILTEQLRQAERDLARLEELLEEALIEAEKASADYTALREKYDHLAAEFTTLQGDLGTTAARLELLEKELQQAALNTNYLTQRAAIYEEAIGDLKQYLREPVARIRSATTSANTSVGTIDPPPGVDTSVGTVAMPIDRNDLSTIEAEPASSEDTDLQPLVEANEALIQAAGIVRQARANGNPALKGLPDLEAIRQLLAFYQSIRLNHLASPMNSSRREAASGSRLQSPRSVTASALELRHAAAVRIKTTIDRKQRLLSDTLQTRVKVESHSPAKPFIATRSQLLAGLGIFSGKNTVSGSQKATFMGEAQQLQKNLNTNKNTAVLLKTIGQFISKLGGNTQPVLTLFAEQEMLLNQIQQKISQQHRQIATLEENLGLDSITYQTKRDRIPHKISTSDKNKFQKRRAGVGAELLTKEAARVRLSKTPGVSTTTIDQEIHRLQLEQAQLDSDLQKSVITPEDQKILKLEEEKTKLSALEETEYGLYREARSTHLVIDSLHQLLESVYQ